MDNSRLVASRPVTSTIWVGNLPFETTETELTQLLSTVGPVKTLRLITDRDTGRPKGFGFCEFYDKATAESAFRNLNGQEFRGRNIRIDFAEEFSKPQRNDRDDRAELAGGRGGDRGYNSAGGARMIGFAAASQSAQQVASMLGGPASSDRRVQDQLNELLAAKSKPDLWEVLRLLKEFLGGDKEAAKRYFADRPGLTKAVFQAQVLLGMVKPAPAAPASNIATAAPALGAFSQQPAAGAFQEGPIGLGGRIGGPGAPPPPPRSVTAGGPMGLTQPPATAAAPGVVSQQQGPGSVQVVVVDPATGQQQTVVMPTQQLGGLALPPQQPQGILQVPPQQQLPVQQGVVMQQVPDAMQVQQVQAVPQAPQQAGIVQQPASGNAAGGAFPGQDPAQTQALLRQVAAMTDEQISMLPEHIKQQVLYVKEQIRLGAVKFEG